MADERDEGGGLAPETRAITAGRSSNQSALAPILWATTTFTYDTVDEGRRLATAVGPERFYTRYGNPTIQAAEQKLAALEKSMPEDVSAGPPRRCCMM